MINPLRGEIWLIDWSPARGSEQQGKRPSLILQTNKGNLNSNYPNTIVATISTKGREIPFHIGILPDTINNLSSFSYVKCEQILTISKQRLLKKIGSINTHTLKEVEEGISFALGINSAPTPVIS